MHGEQIELWQHEHVFNIEKKSVEKRTLIVVVIAFITMIAEIFFRLADQFDGAACRRMAYGNTCFRFDKAASNR